MAQSTHALAEVTVIDIRQDNMKNTLAGDIQRGLDAKDGKLKSLPTVLLYDTQGLRLFEDITYLDEYYLTHMELETLNRHAAEIVRQVPENAQLVELGSGNLRKIEILLNEFERVQKPVEYLALDLSLDELNRTFAQIPRYDFVSCHGLWGTYEDGLTWLRNARNRERPTWILSMGSSVGNFSRAEAGEFLKGFAEILGPSDSIVIGLDSCKEPDKVFSAYNDREGVTHQFYMNGLRHANEVLGYPAFKEAEWDAIGVFVEDEGCHRAFYVPRKDLTINGAVLKKGEKVFFEQSFKYSPQECQDLWEAASLTPQVKFGNKTGEYFIHLLSPTTYGTNGETNGQKAQVSIPTRPFEYATGPTPTLQDYELLWKLWDTVTIAMVPKDELLSKPIKLRNSLIFYTGHIPVFLDIHLTHGTRGSPTKPLNSEASHYRDIFERGIDPDVDNPASVHDHSYIPAEYPPVSEIRQFQKAVRDRARSLLLGNIQARQVSEALWIGYEHEAMHLETFLYMLLQSEKALPPPNVPKPCFEKLVEDAARNAVPNEWIEIPGQVLSVGLNDPNDAVIPAESYGWDNEKPQRVVQVPSFLAKARPISNGEYAAYLEANHIHQVPASWLGKKTNGMMANDPKVNGGKKLNGVTCDSSTDTRASLEFLEKYCVRTVFGPVPLRWALDWPVSASFDELHGYANWMDCRLPTFEEVESIYAHSANLKATPDTNGVLSDVKKWDSTLPVIKLMSIKLTTLSGQPNGVLKHSGKPRTPDHQPVSIHSQQPAHQPVYVDLHGANVNVGFKHWHPTPVTQSGNKLCGRGEMGGLWEWTSSPLQRHDGFEPMELYPGYTADFFDGKHNIVLGGSWASLPRIAGRTTFVNWYQRNYPYVWAGARLVRDI